MEWHKNFGQCSLLTEVKDIVNNRTLHQAWRNAKCQNFFMAGNKSVPEDDSADVAVCDIVTQDSSQDIRGSEGSG
jgi:hypothetical protein